MKKRHEIIISCSNTTVSVYFSWQMVYIRYQALKVWKGRKFGFNHKWYEIVYFHLILQIRWILLKADLNLKIIKFFHSCLNFFFFVFFSYSLPTKSASCLQAMLACLGTLSYPDSGVMDFQTIFAIFLIPFLRFI